MESIPWIMIAIGFFIILFGVLFVVLIKHRKKPIPTDYRTFFIMGVIWTAFGVVFWEGMRFFLIMGIAFLIIGLANKDKWEKNRRRFKDMDKFERKIIIWVIVILGLLLLVGIVVFMIVNNQVTGNGPRITNFEECIAAGFSAMESYPRQCNDGRDTFTEEMN